MSKTPRTDEHILHHGNGNWHPSAFVLASFARQIETELADARAEIERLALEIENKQYTITCASEENQQLKESLAEARAEIERLKTPMITDMREKMAALCHDQWAGWMEYLFLKSKQVDGCVIIPAWAVERWRRQVATRYPDLSEDEKNSDRNEADRFLSLFNAEIERKDKRIEQMREALSLILEGAIHDFHYSCQLRDNCLCWGCQKKRVNAALAAERGE